MDGDASFTKNRGYNGAGVYVEGTFNMSAGQIGGNDFDSANYTSVTGAGVSVAADDSGAYGTFNMSGGTISYNHALNRAGGVCVEKSGNGNFKGVINMTGGTISNNRAGSETYGGDGGGILICGDFNISGTALIPFGITTNSGTETGLGRNDVFLFYEDCTVGVSGAFSNDAPETVATITPKKWTRGATVISRSGSLSELNSTIISKFKTIDEDFTVDMKGTGSTATGIIQAPIYVASTSTDSTRIGNPGVTSGARGTRAKPYASIEAAVAACTDSSLDFTIQVDGTLKGAQKIISTVSKPINAKSITLTKRIGSTGSAIICGKDGDTNNRALEISAASNDFEVTITDIKITEGNYNGNGGGILLSKGTLKLGSGVQVTGNQGNYGGGIWTGPGTNLFIYDDAIIGDTVETPAENSTNDTSKYANRAQYNGGGIFTNGNVYIGYSGFNASNQLISSTMTNGGVRRNLCNANGGGGIYIGKDSAEGSVAGKVQIGSGNVSYNTCLNSGGGIYVQEGTVNLNAAKLHSNKAIGTNSHGGAIFLYANGCGGSITGNSVLTQNTAGGLGGAVCISYGTSFTMTAGTIGDKDDSDKANVSSQKGGAIYNSGTLTIQGNAYIPYGGSENHNDVCLYGSNSQTRTITLKDSLTKHSSEDPIVIVPYEWKRGKQVLSKQSPLTEITAELAGKIKTVDSDFTVGLKTGDTSAAYIDAPIYVSDTTVDTADQRGTSTKPYSTIQSAITNAVDANHTTVTVKGTVSTGQEITSYPSGITAIELTGYKAPGNTTSTAKLEGTSSIETSMLRFSVSSATLTITDLTITKGNAKGDNAASYGGGIYIGAGNVKLGNGVVITKNIAKNFGGGVYVENGANLFMYGTALIGESASTSTAVATSTSNCGNYAYGGGGVYNNGNVYLGYTTTTDSTSNPLNDNYGIRRNYANSSTQYGGEGGGYYSASYGKLYMASGKIALNASLHSGGGISARGQVSITGGSVEGNNAGTNGGGIYAYTTDGVTLSNATIKANTASKGGAVYVESMPFKIGKDAYIPGGADKKNDVYLPSGKYATLIEAPKFENGSGYSEKIVLNPENLTWGTQVLSGYSYISDNYNKFVGPGEENPSDWAVVPKGTETSMIGVMNGTVYVASSDTTSDQVLCKVKGNDTNGDGTRSKPYATIAKALTKAWDTTKTTTLTIRIDGEIKGAQTISGTFNAKCIYISSCRLSVSPYTRSGVLNGNFSSGTPGTTLTINTTTPVIVQEVKITGGYNTNGNGGGVAINGNSKVHLGYLTKITGNYARNGGGVSIASNATSIISDHATIGYYPEGDNPSAVTSSSTLAEGINKASLWGGGIYNEGTTYIGYSYNSSTDQISDPWDDYWANIMCNYAASLGGGIYTKGKLYITDEDTSIKWNGAGSGGGICVDVSDEAKRLILRAGNIASNSASNQGGGIFVNNNCYIKTESSGHEIFINGNSAQKGGGIYVASNGEFRVDSDTGGFYVYNNEATDKGGGVYAAGTFYFYQGWIGQNNSNQTKANTAPTGKGIYVSNTSLFVMKEGPNAHVDVANDIFLQVGAYIGIDWSSSSVFSEDPPPGIITPADYNQATSGNWKLVKDTDQTQYSASLVRFKVTPNGTTQYKVANEGWLQTVH